MILIYKAQLFLHVLRPNQWLDRIFLSFVIALIHEYRNLEMTSWLGKKLRVNHLSCLVFNMDL